PDAKKRHGPEARNGEAPKAPQVEAPGIQKAEGPKDQKGPATAIVPFPGGPELASKPPEEKGKPIDPGEKAKPTDTGTSVSVAPARVVQKAPDAPVAYVPPQVNEFKRQAALFVQRPGAVSLRAGEQENMKMQISRSNFSGPVELKIDLPAGVRASSAG